MNSQPKKSLKAVCFARCSVVLYLVAAGLLSFISLNYSCTGLIKRPDSQPSTELPKFESQKKIIRQGNKIITTPWGRKHSILFGYDRNSDALIMRDSQTGDGVDILEFKLIFPGNTWSPHPFLILVDDDFDSIADRMFLDSNFDEILNVVHQITHKSIRMDGKQFHHFNFWENVPVIPDSGDDLAVSVTTLS